nr:glycosyl hydrolase 5 family protein-like [Ipomoea batatas]
MIPFLTIFLLSFASLSNSLPLSASSRWITDDQSGERVKLACASWAGHLEPMLPEGLDRRPLSQIATHVSTMGFNCVRLTWATYMFTRYANVTVVQSFRGLGLTEAISGLASRNPNLLRLNLVDAWKAVVEEIGRHGIMMVLDNHVSKPMWCCADHDGNGFFGSVYFDPDEWLQGLAIVANVFKDTPMVVGMSLRNELRGPLQNVDAWYKYVEKGAKTINNANPNLLRGGKDDAAPLFVSEFGIDQMGESEADNRHLPCMLSYLADLDLDWSVWALQGSYYLREGQHGPDETYGMFNTNWTALRNPNFHSKLEFLQQKLQDPKSSGPTYNLLYHPLSGRCAQVVNDQIHMSDCMGASPCIQEADGMPIQMIESLKCLTVVGEDLPLGLSTICNDSQSNTWSLASNSSMSFQLANRGDNGVVLCLDFDSSYSPSTILTRKCVGLEEGDMRNPQTQWFKLIPSNTK